MKSSSSDLPLVARESEISVIRSLLATARRGVGGAVYLVGPSGIGKTRLASEALQLAREAGFRCAWGAGWSEGGVPPLWPWQSVLTQLGQHGGAALLNGAAASTSSELERFATFRAVVDAIVEVGASEPVLIVIEDAHSADLGALLLTRFVLRALRAVAACVVITANDSPELDPAVRDALGDLARETTVVSPAPFSIDGLDQLLRQVGSRVPDSQLNDMHELTGGNPLLIGELLAAGRSLPNLTVESARSVLQLRLRGLAPEAHDVVAGAAVLGTLATVPLALAVAGIDETSGRALIGSAQRAGVLMDSDDDSCRFAHRLLAEALLASRTPQQLADLHSRVAQAVESTGAAPAVESVIAAAHHRLAAASILRDRASVVSAVAACRIATRALVAGFAYEAAAQLLARAIELHEPVGMAAPADLLIEIARIDLSAGDLREARSWFRRAAEQAVDPVDLAQAAVGLGGIWVHEHRTAVEHASFMGLLDEGLSSLGDERPDLAARLRMRIAAERIYTAEGSLADVHRAVRSARAVGQPLVLAESLSLLHHTMLGPANTGPARLAIADELIQVAAAAGDEVLALMGVLWRAVDLLLMGDERAERALTEVRERADALQVAAVIFVLDAIDVMRLLRDGHVEAAEEAAHRCFDLGFGIGDADAALYLGAHLMTIRWLQLRANEILPIARHVAESPTIIEGDVAARAALAALAAMSGDLDQAKADLHHVMKGLRDAETSSNWMITMFSAAEAATLLGDVKTAEAVYSALLPYRHLPILGSLGVVCLGSAERTLGVAARTLGDIDLAVDHFEQAVERNHRFGNRMMAAVSEGELGCALIERAAAGDTARGQRHVEAAVTGLSEFGLIDRAAALRDAADRRLLRSPVPDGEIEQTGSTWRLAYGEHEVQISDSVGVRRLIQLLERPWKDVAASDLAGDIGDAARYDVNDVAALRAYREHIDEMRREIDEADEDNDIERASRLRDELDELLDHLAPSIGLRGRSRTFSDSAERARVAVRKSLGRVFAAVGDQDAEFGRSVHDSVRTGGICRFEPVAQFPSVWRRRNPE